MLITSVSRRAAGAALALIGSLSTTSQAAPVENLFIVARSTNANIVRYDIRRTPNGLLRVDSPVDAYWEMRMGQRRREELSWMEREFAYGFNVLNATSKMFSLRMRAFDKREIRVEAFGTTFRARVTIAGVWATLNRIYVQTEAGGLLPKVRYVELQGTTDAGRPVYERISVD